MSAADRRQGTGAWIHEVVDGFQDFAVFLAKLWIVIGWVVVLPLAVLCHETVGPWLVRLLTWQ